MLPAGELDDEALEVLGEFCRSLMITLLEESACCGLSFDSCDGAMCCETSFRLVAFTDVFGDNRVSPNACVIVAVFKSCA